MKGFVRPSNEASPSGSAASSETLFEGDPDRPDPRVNHLNSFLRRVPAALLPQCDNQYRRQAALPTTGARGAREM